MSFTNKEYIVDHNKRTGQRRIDHIKEQVRAAFTRMAESESALRPDDEPERMVQALRSEIGWLRHHLEHAEASLVELQKTQYFSEMLDAMDEKE